MIPVTASISISEDELSITYIRSGGPGGQNVNKVSSAAQLRFDARHSPSLDSYTRTRLLRIAGSKATSDGVIVITANRFRTQVANRNDAIARLVGLIAEAAYRPAKRIPTKPGKAAKQRRLDEKQKRGSIKKMRSGKPTSDD